MKLIDDLVDLSELSEDSFSILINEFNTNALKSFNDFSKYQKLYLEHNIEQEKADTLYGVLAYILRFLIDEKSVDEGLQKFEQDRLSDDLDKVKAIWDRIKKSIPNLNGFINILKERDLLKVSNGLDSLKIVCDVRPLFDVERENIIKYTYPILLSLEIRDSDKKLVFELSETDLINAQSEVDTAVRKIGILKKKFPNDG